MMNMVKAVLRGLGKVLVKFLIVMGACAIVIGIIAAFGEAGAFGILIALAALVTVAEVSEEVSTTKFKDERIKESLINDLDSLYSFLCDDLKKYSSNPDPIIKVRIDDFIGMYNETLHLFSRLKHTKACRDGYEERLNNLLSLYNYE